MVNIYMMVNALIARIIVLNVNLLVNACYQKKVTLIVMANQLKSVLMVLLLMLRLGNVKNVLKLVLHVEVLKVINV